MTTIALVDYGAGNLTSVTKALAAVGADVRVAGSPAALDGCDGIVVPGVGHFQATASLGPEWRRAIRQAIAGGTPVLGICLGLQWLFDGSAEAPDVPGLGVFPGRCFFLTGDVKVPHVGWNNIACTAPSRLLDGVPSGSFVYFTHSFAAPIGTGSVAAATHGATFAAAVERERTFGVQFHPEKSGAVGVRILANFVAAAGG
jgi:glutamine amidotransferase